jgi:hypothetical protein
MSSARTRVQTVPRPLVMSVNDHWYQTHTRSRYSNQISHEHSMKSVVYYTEYRALSEHAIEHRESAASAYRQASNHNTSFFLPWKTQFLRICRVQSQSCSQYFRSRNFHGSMVHVTSWFGHLMLRLLPFLISVVFWLSLKGSDDGAL